MIAWLFIALLGLLGALYVSTPLRKGPRRDLPGRKPFAVEAVRRKEEALAAIVDLERDLEAGKLNEADFATLRREQEGHALDALRAIDGMAGVEREDEEIEAEIAQARARLECTNCGATRTGSGGCPRCGAS